MFSETNQPSFCITQHTATTLHSVISEFKTPKRATLRFKQGLFYLHSTTIGYIIVAMNDEKNLKMLEDACLKVAEKLEKKDVGKKVLLSMLDKADDTLKPQFIRALVLTADKEVALALMKIISNPVDIAEEIRETVLLVACQTIGHCSYYEATSCLKTILSHHAKDSYPFDPYVAEAASLAISQLEQLKPEERTTPQHIGEKEPSHEGKSQSIHTTAVPAIPSVPKILEKLPEKKKIDSLVAEDKKTEALQVIMALIKTATEHKQFDKAEALQEWLLLIEPMALPESIRATELIEESKVALINEEFYFNWKGIVEILTTEEFIAFYHAMTSKIYANGEDIALQGQVHSKLYLVNNGRVQLYTHIEGREIPLQIIQEGGLLGHSTFFELSVWTSGAKSQGAEVYALSFENLQKLEKKFPGIESKLSDYCSHIETSTTLLRKMKRSRRQLERKSLSGKISFLLLGADGNKTEVGGRGGLLDISQGGVCFTVHSSKRKNTRILFAKSIHLTIKRSNSRPPIERTGKILAVRDHDIIGNAYSVHVQFDSLITGTELREIVAFCR